MALLLVPLCLALLMLSMRGAGLSRALLRAFVLIGMLIVLSTEIFSAVDSLSRGPLIASWAAAATAAGVAAFRARERRLVSSEPLSLTEVLLAGGLLAILTAEFVVAVSSMPNTWDSMTYHLSRVGRWIQQDSVEFAPVTNSRQLWPAPMAEYAITHAQLLSGSIKASNLVQWAGSVAVAVGVYRLAALLSLDRTGRLIAAIFAATVPMAVMQATSTQNDLITAAWVVIAAEGFLAAAHGSDRAAHAQAVAATALAFMTKGTSVLFLVPFGLIWLVALYRRSPRSAAAGVVAALAVGAVINGPFQWRVLQAYDRPLSPAAASDRLVAENPAASLLSNSVRNFFTQSVPEGQAAAWTPRARSAVQRLGIAPDDAATVAFPPFVLSGILDEDYVPSPLHVPLIVVLLAMAAVLRRRLPAPVRWQIAAALAAYLVFVAYLKWQPWVNRLLLPSMVLWAAPVAYVLRRHLHRYVSAAVVVSLLAWAGNCLLHNQTRPLRLDGVSVLSRADNQTMFAKQPQILKPYSRAAELLMAQHVQHVGLVQNGDDWEYPLRVLTGGVESPLNLYDAVATGWLRGDRPELPLEAVFCTALNLCRPDVLPGWQRHALGDEVTLLLAPTHATAPRVVGPPTGLAGGQPMATR